MKPGRFYSAAVALYDGPGDGSPHYREGIIATLEAALEGAYRDGQHEAWPKAKEFAMREVSAALTGAVQSLTSRITMIERDLKEPGT